MTATKAVHRSPFTPTGTTDEQRGGLAAGHPGVVPGEVQSQITIRLSERLQEIAREIGDGNLSAGIRRALEAEAARKGK